MHSCNIVDMSVKRPTLRIKRRRIPSQSDRRLSAISDYRKMLDCTTPRVGADKLAQTLAVSKRTAHRWIAAKRMPMAYALLWQLLSTGDLGVLDVAFKGFVLRSGHIIDDSQQTHTPAQLRARRYTELALAELRSERGRWNRTSDQVTSTQVVSLDDILDATAHNSPHKTRRRKR